MGATHGGEGGGGGGGGGHAPLKNFAQTRKNGKTHTKIEQFGDPYTKPGIYQGFRSRGVGWTMGVSMNVDASPITSRGHFPRECSQIYPGNARQGEEVYTPRGRNTPHTW